MAHVIACERVKVADCPAKLPIKYIEYLEQNQKLMSCCRHPENHYIEAWYSSEAEAAKGVPDIYRFICTEVHPKQWDEEKQIWYHERPNGERWHDRFCIGGGDKRPYWEIR